MYEDKFNNISNILNNIHIKDKFNLLSKLNKKIY